MTSSVGVIVIKDKQVLLVKHTEGARHLTDSYGVPGGRAKLDEDEKLAAFRELFEETGITATELVEFPENIFTATLQMKHGSEPFTWRVFLANGFYGDLKSSHETTPEWISVDRISDYKLIGDTKRAIDNALKSINHET